MHTGSPTIPPAPHADAQRILQLLASGRTTQQVADLTSWPRARVVALINGHKGWLLDHERDTVYQPGNKGMVPQLPEGVEPARVDIDIEAKPAPRRTGSVDELLASAAGLDDKTVQRELRKVTEALVKLRTAVSTIQQRAEQDAARQEEIRVLTATIEVLEGQLAKNKARARELGIKRPATAAKAPAPARAADVGPKVVRAWAAERGIECSPYGKVPQPIVDQYQAAHAGEPDG